MKFEKKTRSLKWMDFLWISLCFGDKRMCFSTFSMTKTTKRWGFSTRSSQKLDLVRAFFRECLWENPCRSERPGSLIWGCCEHRSVERSKPAPSKYLLLTSACTSAATHCDPNQSRNNYSYDEEWCRSGRVQGSWKDGLVLRRSHSWSGS